MAEAAHRQATYQDLLDAPEGLTAEILGGELHLTSAPGYPHQMARTGLGIDAGGQFARRGDGRPGGWVILDEPELHLGRPDPEAVVVVPDLAGWTADRFQAPAGHGHTLVPDWVCEVLSPGARNVRRDRVLKPDIYHRAGVPLVWLVDPAARLVEVLRAVEGGYLRVAAVGGDGEARLPPFEAVAFDMGAWWVDTGSEP